MFSDGACKRGTIFTLVFCSIIGIILTALCFLGFLPVLRLWPMYKFSYFYISFCLGSFIVILPSVWIFSLVEKKES